MNIGDSIVTNNVFKLVLMWTENLQIYVNWKTQTCHSLTVPVLDLLYKCSLILWVYADPYSLEAMH